MNSFSRINLRIRKSPKKFVRIRTTSGFGSFLRNQCYVANGLYCKNIYFRVKQIWENGPVRKIISNISRPILKILKNCHCIDCDLQFKMYPKCIYERIIPELKLKILFVVIICDMLFIQIIIKLHSKWLTWPKKYQVRL